ncbi:MAG: phosphate ABC transporter substrate-binding protein [Clostridia bacterium]
MRNIRGRVKTISIAFILMIAAILAGCSLSPKQEEQHTLLIAGASDFLTITQIVQKEFEKQNPSDHIISQGGGAIPGIISLKNDAIDIALSSRDLEEHEDERNLKSILVAKDALLIVTNPANPVTNLTVDQVRDIYSGEITSWKAVGGVDAPITVLSRESSSTTLGSFIDMIMGGEQVTEHAIETEYADKMEDEIAKNQHAIGFISMKHYKPIVKALKIDNVEANKQTILSGRYPISRSFFLIVKATPEGLSKRFIEFVMSDQGQSILENAGAIRVY